MDEIDGDRYSHDDVIKWKHFPRYWPFVRGIHRSRWIPRTKVSDAGLWKAIKIVALHEGIATRRTCPLPGLGARSEVSTADRSLVTDMTENHLPNHANAQCQLWLFGLFKYGTNFECTVKIRSKWLLKSGQNGSQVRVLLKTVKAINANPVFLIVRWQTLPISCLCRHLNFPPG